jgi:hypothetical protein
MLKSSFAFVVLMLLLLAVPLAAQTPTSGELRWQQGGTIPLGPYTYIDATHPVSSDGTITNAAVRWLTDDTCSAEIKIKFFRRDGRGILGTLQLIGSAGPFDAVNGLNRLSFPPIPVLKGDLIGVTQLKSGCGGTTFSDSPRGADTIYEISGDFTGGSLNTQSVTARAFETLDVVGSHGASRLVGTLPVAGSAAGGFGSFFRTELSLANSSPYPSNVVLVFHPAGVAALPTDPTKTIALAAFASVSFPDVVATMGLSGLGTIEVLSDAYAPVVTARIYNDAGAAGTSGFTEELITPNELLIDGFVVPLQIAPDLTSYRVNVGIRTFGKPVHMIASVYDANGTYVKNATAKDYPANYFEQVPLSTFLAGLTPPPGGFAQIYLSGGAAAIYTSTNDNRTNDGSLKFLNPR